MTSNVIFGWPIKADRVADVSRQMDDALDLGRRDDAFRRECLFVIAMNRGLIPGEIKRLSPMSLRELDDFLGTTTLTTGVLHDIAVGAPLLDFNA